MMYNIFVRLIRKYLKILYFYGVNEKKFNDNVLKYRLMVYIFFKIVYIFYICEFYIKYIYFLLIFLYSKYFN